MTTLDDGDSENEEFIDYTQFPRRCLVCIQAYAQRIPTSAHVGCWATITQVPVEVELRGMYWCECPCGTPLAVPGGRRSTRW